MLADYQTLLNSLVRDDAQRLGAGATERALGLALEQLSVVSPRELVADVVSANGSSLPLPAAWDAGFSQVLSLEYPVGATPPSYLDDDTYMRYLSLSGEVIVLLSALPAGSTVRVRFSAKHVVTSSVDTVPLFDREAVAKYAAALLCDELAAVYASEVDATISADRAPGQTPSQAWAWLARQYRKSFAALMGAPDQTSGAATPQKAAGAVGSVFSSRTDAGLMYHRGR